MATWKISRLDRKTADGFVTTAHWTVTATDGDFSASVYGTCGFDGELTTPYADLTEAQVLEWVWASLDKAAYEASLAAQIEAHMGAKWLEPMFSLQNGFLTKKNPVSATGLPW